MLDSLKHRLVTAIVAQRRYLFGAYLFAQRCTLYFSGDNAVPAHSRASLRRDAQAALLAAEVFDEEARS